MRAIYVFRLLWAPVLVLLLHATSMALTNNEYGWDEPMHVLGGAAIAWMVCEAWQLLREKGYVPVLPPWLFGTLIVSLVMTVGVVWEWYEYLRWVTISPWMDLTLADTLKDLGYDVAGAIALAVGMGRFRTGLGR